ncbi:MAG: PKD domain-containing protein [Bacteroidetes bacterium]|nr:MAG: PKD domain-containing protein [Bacteroidota bacterium]
MKLRFFTAFFSLCLSFSLFGQRIFQGTPNQNPVFKKALDAQFYAYDVYKIDVPSLESYVKSAGTYASFQLLLGKKHHWDLHLSPFDMRSPDYVLTVQGPNGTETFPAGPNDAFRGIVGNSADNTVNFVINRDYFSMMVVQGDQTWFLEPVQYLAPGAPDDLFVVYEQSDVIPKKENGCIALEVQDKSDSYKYLGKNDDDAEFLACKEVQIAIAADVAMFNKYGSVGAVNGHTTTVLMNVQTNYDNEFNDELMFVIATQFVATTNDPWTSNSNPNTYLNNFTSWGNSGGFGVTYDVAGCWTDINLNGSVIGIAWLNGICNSNRYHVCQDFSSNMNLLRVLWAHEMGHNFSCTHDPSGSPTIMAPAVNNTNTWSGQSVSQVNSYVPTRTCLTACIGSAPPSANFSVNPTIGCAPLTVQCTDLSSNGPTSWSWTVKLNGQTMFTSALQNPTFTLVTAGCYDITLVASNSVGSSTPFTKTVTVNTTPVANFSWSNAGTTVIFSNQTTPNDPCLTPTSYLWDFGDGTTSTDFEPTHTYTTENFFNVTLTASNSCGVNMFTTQVAAFFPPVANFTADPQAGCAVLDVDFVNTSSPNALSATWTFEGGNPPVSTDFFPSVQYFTPGTYDVTLEVCNPAGCDVLFMPDFIEILDQPIADAGPTMLIDCDNPEVPLDGTNSSQGSNYIYTWTTVDGNIVSGANTLTPTVDAPGEYCLEVMNSAGENCTVSDCVQIFENTLAPTADAGPNQTIDCINSSVTLDGTNSSQGATFSYQWTGPSIVSGANTLTPEVDLPGIYTLLVSNSENGCTAESTTEVIDDMTAPIADAGSDMTLDCNNIEVMLDGSGSSQGPGFTYEWSGPGIISGANTLTPTVNAAGVYVLIVTDTGNGCTEISDAVVNEDFVTPIANAGPTQIIDCNTPQVDLNGTNSSQGANFTYAWSGPNIISGANTPTPTVGSGGTYTLVVTNTNNGCTESSDVEVVENTTPPIADAGADMELTCAVTSVQLDGSGSSQGSNYTYQWDGPGIVSGANTLAPTVNATGTYILTVTDIDNGCTETSEALVTGDNTVPTADAGPAQQLDCAHASVTLDGTGSSQGNGETYSWSGPGIVSGANTLTPTVNATGTYTLTVTGANGCTKTSEVEVNEDFTIPTADAGPTVNFTCNAASVVLDGTNSSQGNNFTYLWTGPEVISGENTLQPTVGQTGTYALTVTNTNNGCTSVSEVEVSEIPAPVATISGQTNVDCHGNATGAATVSVSGGTMPYTYQWSNGATEATVNGLVAGTYEVVITDADNCTDTAQVTITEPDTLTANATATGLTSVGANDGTAAANPAGGTPNYTYAWSNGGTTQMITGLAPDIYTVTVTDANGCTDIQTVTVADFDCSPVGLMVSGQDALCAGSSDGEVSAEGTNGEMPFSYAWSTGDTTSTVTGLPAGTYSVTATDNNGCIVVDTIAISEPELLEASILQSANVDCNGNATGAATAGASGGTPGYTYAWSSGGTGANESNLPAGTHTVTITDANGCQSVTEVTITEPAPLSPNISATNETAVGAGDGTASANPSGGTPDYTYLWSTGATSQTIENLAPGEYCVTITDANGCTEEACVAVNAFDCGAISADFDVIWVSCNGGNDGEATILLNGGTPPYQYTWSNDATGDTATGLSAGTYQVTATDDKGCVFTSSVEVPEPEPVVVNILEQNNVTCPGEANGSAMVEALGGNGDFTYAWSVPATGPAVENLAAGTYEVTATDVNGCTGVLSVEIATDPDTEPPLVIATDISVELDANGLFVLTPDMIDGGSSDNCDLATLTLDLTELTCDHVGATTVTLTGTDAAGNTASDLATVFVSDVTPPVVQCPDDIVTNMCAIPVNYDLPTGEDLCGLVTVELVEGLPSGSLFPSGTTLVTWSGTDPSGNTASCSFEVTIQNDLAAGVDITQPACFGETGSAIALPDGGTAPYSYQWDDPAGQTTPEAVNLPAGIYNVVVTDSVGCIVAATVMIEEPAPVVVGLDELINESGSNADGAISITPDGGTGDTYTYEWTKDGVFFSNEEDLTNLAAGEYCVVVTDQNGCTTSECYVVEMINGTNNSELNQFITVLPNPTSGKVFVDFRLNDRRNVHIQWYDYLGRQLMEGTPGMVRAQTFEFDLTDLASGVYLVRIWVDDDVLIKKVIVE